MNAIVTSTGKTIPCSFFGVAGAGVLFADVDMDFIDAYQVFSSKAETQRLKYLYESNGEQCERVVDGFTVFMGINLLERESFPLRVSLRRPFADEIGGNTDG